MRTVAVMLCLLLTLPAWAQTALSLEGMSQEQRADYGKLMRGYAAGAGDYQLDRELEPVPSAPMPCDVVVYMREMRLPEVPASLAPAR